jgi:hypothetical protein
MPDRIYRIKPRRNSLAEVSFEVRLQWTSGILSRLLGVSKKNLRNALKIVRNPELVTKIKEKGKLVERTFHFGFREFFLTKNRKKRQILAPHPDVQLIFKHVQHWLEDLDVSHSKAFGFVRDKNPKKALEALMDARHFFGIDIADAFPSITLSMVTTALERLHVPEAIVDVLAWLVTYDYNGQRRLPQGSSCSPLLLNLVYRPMCDEIDETCRHYGVDWNVYGDDFNVASQTIPPDLKNEILSIPAKYGLSINEKKTRDNVQASGGITIPHILGLTIVDGKVHIKRRTKEKIRRIIYAAMVHDAYSDEQVAGMIGYVRHIYGEKNNWPGNILRIYKQYQKERRIRDDAKRLFADQSSSSKY